MMTDKQWDELERRCQYPIDRAALLEAIKLARVYSDTAQRHYIQGKHIRLLADIAERFLAQD